VGKSCLRCELASYHVVFTTICLPITARHQHASRILIFWIWSVVSRTCWIILHVNIQSELALQDPSRCQNQHLVHVHIDHMVKHVSSISRLDFDHLECQSSLSSFSADERLCGMYSAHGCRARALYHHIVSKMDWRPSSFLVQTPAQAEAGCCLGISALCHSRAAWPLKAPSCNLHMHVSSTHNHPSHAPEMLSTRYAFIPSHCYCSIRWSASRPDLAFFLPSRLSWLCQSLLPLAPT
jgi:hypothetical protein